MEGDQVSKALVFVLVPYSVGVGQVSDHAARLLKPHAMPDDRSSGWYDYLCQIGPVFDDPVTEGGLPDRQKRSLHRHVCDVSLLPPEPLPDALVTPDGTWHSCEPPIPDDCWDQGLPDLASSANWSVRYNQLLAAHPHCWVVVTWAHS